MEQTYVCIFVFVFEEHPGATKFVQTQPRLPGPPGFNSHPRNFSIANPSFCFLSFLKKLGVIIIETDKNSSASLN